MDGRVMCAEASPSRIRRDFQPGPRSLLLACSMSASPALAEPAISWEAPAGCSDAQQVIAVAAELTGSPAPVIASKYQIRAVVEPSGSGWQLSLTLVEGARRRERLISAPSCSELARAAGVALALALEPSVSAEALPSEPATRANADRLATELVPGLHAAGLHEAGLHEAGLHEAGLGATAPQAAEVESASASTTSAFAVLEWRLEAAALLDGVALGAAAPGVGVSLGARHAALSGFVYGAWLPPRREEVGGGGAVELMLLTGGVRACHELARGLLAFDACGGLELGRLVASGEGLAGAASFADWWLAPSLGIALGSGLGGALYVRAGADLLVPVLREAYRVNDGVLVHRPSSAGFRAGVALGIVLGGGG